jgi:hypothetical protein
MITTDRIGSTFPVIASNYRLPWLRRMDDSGRRVVNDNRLTSLSDGMIGLIMLGLDARDTDQSGIENH